MNDCNDDSRSPAHLIEADLNGGESGECTGEIEISRGRFYFERFERLGDPDDLKKAIEHQSRVLALTSDGHPQLPSWLGALAKSHSDRFQHLGEIDDIEKAIEYYCRALALTPDDHPAFPAVLANIGTSYTHRFDRLGELVDIKKAIEYESQALALTTDNHPDLPDRLGNLGASYYRQFQHLGELNNLELEKAINCISRAVDLYSDNHPNLPKQLVNLGIFCSERFENLGGLEDLEKAIECESRALALTPEEHLDFPRRLFNIGTSYMMRFERLGELDDLDKGIEHATRAVALTPNDHLNLPILVGNLAASYNTRFDRFGELKDIEQAIEHGARAVALTPDGNSELPRRLANLGKSYSSRFNSLGELDDLEKTLEYETRAIELASDDYPDLPALLGNLGTSYGTRFQCLGELEDIEQAIEYGTRALTLTPDDHPDLPARLSSLGWSYNIKFRDLKDLDDLEETIELGSRAVALTPNGHPELPYMIATLGTAYSSRFDHFRELDDLERAIEHTSRAFALTPDDSPSLPNWLNHLATFFRCRYERLEEIADLEKAIQYHTRAVALTPDGHPESYWSYYNFAHSQFAHYEYTGDSSDLQTSLNYSRKASQALNGAPRAIFKASLNWAKRITKHSSLQANSVEAYQTTIELLPGFIWLGATTNQRYEDLATVKTLAVDAAMVAIRSSHYSLALEWLEHARCVVWNQNLMLRSPLDQLHSSHPDLATRLKTAAMGLHAAGSEPRTSEAPSSSSPTPEQVAQKHRRLAKEYNDLVSEARRLPGFEDFLQPIKANGLIHAARSGTIVVINCHKVRCDALLISPNQDAVSHVPLPNFTRKKAKHARCEIEASLRHQGIRDRGVKVRQQEGYRNKIGVALATMWNDIVKPILDYLGYTLALNDAVTDNLPHITWCPTGPLAFLPLHAAGDYDQPRSRVFDYVVSSYTPTLTALLASSPSELSNNCRVLGIGQEATPGYSPLPGTTLELAHVQSHTPDGVEYTQLMGSQATTADVLDAMAQHDWVHLACHAHQNVEDPTESGFFLHDGTLDLGSINRRSLKNKGLAFLSACQTATGDDELPDEAIHLASGMLMAGYTSVIATMWSVNDKDAPFVADRVYGQLMRDRRIGKGEAGRALHRAVGQLRETIGEKEFGRWVPYIHIGS